MGSVTKASKQDISAARYKNARIYFLMIIFVSIMNMVLLFMESEQFYLISAMIPYMAVLFSIGTGASIFGTVGFWVAAVFLGLCVLCWLLSKERPGWLVAGAVLYGLDLIPAVYLYAQFRERTFLMAAVVHAFMLVYIIAGIVSRYRQKAVPVDFQHEPEAEHVRGTPLRRADMDVKFRVLLEADYGGRKIVYRRVKRINEMVIDRYVYDEIELGIEPAHSLSARINGHLLEVGYDGKSYSYFSVDGVQQSKKIRWY